MEPISSDFYFEVPLYIFRNQTKNIIHERLIEWIVFQTSFNVFEIV